MLHIKAILIGSGILVAMLGTILLIGMYPIIAIFAGSIVAAYCLGRGYLQAMHRS